MEILSGVATNETTGRGSWTYIVITKCGDFYSVHATGKLEVNVDLPPDAEKATPTVRQRIRLMKDLKEHHRKVLERARKSSAYRPGFYGSTSSFLS